MYGEHPRRSKKLWWLYCIPRQSFTILFSVNALHGILPATDLDIWQDFVMACTLFCSTVITEARAALAHTDILKFCRNIEQHYSRNRITLNMHLHTHLLDCILDCGPVYSFWLFSLEHYNGILEEYGTNQRSVEVQLMQKLCSEDLLEEPSIHPQSKNSGSPPMFQLVEDATKRGVLSLSTAEATVQREETEGHSNRLAVHCTS